MAQPRSPFEIPIILLCLVSGCASLAGLQPGVIAIRNLSGRQAQSVSIQEDREAGSPRRVGGMSPVMQNQTYTYVRPADAKPLPARVRVVFSYAGGAERSVALDLRPALRQATGDANEAIVFELQPGGTVDAYLEHIQP